MRYRAAFMAAAALCVATMPIAGCSGSPSRSDDAAVQALITRELELFRKRDFDTLYAQYSSSFRERCTRDAFVASIDPATDPAKIELQDVSITVEGDHARAAYVISYDGQRTSEVAMSDPDVFVKSDGRWYDDLDSHTHC